MRASLVASRGGDPLGRHSVLPQVLSSAPPGGRSGLQLGPLLRSPSWAVAPTGGWTGRSAQVLRAGQSPNAPAFISAQPCPPVPQASHPPQPHRIPPRCSQSGFCVLGSRELFRGPEPSQRTWCPLHGWGQTGPVALSSWDSGSRCPCALPCWPPRTGFWRAGPPIHWLPGPQAQQRGLWDCTQAPSVCSGMGWAPP